MIELGGWMRRDVRVRVSLLYGCARVKYINSPTTHHPPCPKPHQVLRLTHAGEKHLRLAAVRFVRAIVGTKDDFYNRHLVCNVVCVCDYV